MYTITVTVKVTPRTECYEKIKQTLINISNESKKETGCHIYNVHEIADDAGTKSFFVYEVYNSQESHHFHLSQDYTQELIEYFNDSLAKPIEIEKFETNLL